MRDYTNLQWPEAPFGADQRPFGHQRDMLTAFALDWTAPSDAGRLPVAAATVYLRVRRHGTVYTVGEESLSIGFRATVIEDPAEVPHLLVLTDRALTRARRHATILAGHRLDDDLTRMASLSAVPLRGTAGVLAAWAHRRVKERGVALMVDTAAEARDTGTDLDMSLDPVPELVPDCPACAAWVARRVLARCLATGLTAAVHAGRYRWEGTFRLGDAVDRAAWDVLSADADTGSADHRHSLTRREVAHAAK
ncbi:hypothetical protein ACNTMW_05365 [Planosporangium sp. 12N6]|uniref:hypothetical protein n=1 Tax=Planosporangium spinosum TaxID=3402278 RepID=UPI003CF54FB1